MTGGKQKTESFKMPNLVKGMCLYVFTRIWRNIVHLYLQNGNLFVIRIRTIFFILFSLWKKTLQEKGIGKNSFSRPFTNQKHF